MIYIYIIVCYSAIKMNEMFPFAKTQMDLDSITLSEIIQRMTNTLISFICRI